MSQALPLQRLPLKISLPDPKTAYDHLFAQVHAQAFTGRMAQRGYPFRTEKEARDAITLAGKLRLVDNEPSVKAASADNPYAAASTDLDTVLAKRGLDGGIRQASAQERDVSIRQIAAKLASDAGIYNAVLSLKAAEAVAVAQRLGATRAEG